jgi:hypothetical protein
MTNFESVKEFLSETLHKIENNSLSNEEKLIISEVDMFLKIPLKSMIPTKMKKFPRNINKLFIHGWFIHNIVKE